MNEPTGPVVVALDEQTDIDVDLDRWQRLAVGALRAEGLTDGELNLLFIGEPEMHELNETHMGEARPTDVLSFPLDGGDASPAGEALIGDIVVCPAYAARQAATHAGVRGNRGCVEDELALLVVHGVLHVLGWDHADAEEAEAMQRREQLLLDRLHR